MGHLIDKIRILTDTGKIVSRIIEHNTNSPLNTGSKQLTSVTHSQGVAPVKNRSTIKKTYVSIGGSHTKRLLTQANGPQTEVVRKRLKFSSEDYQEYEKHKQLTCTCGFNQKTFLILGADTHMTTDDFMKLYQAEKKYKKDLIRADPESAEINGCTLYTKQNILKLILTLT